MKILISGLLLIASLTAVVLMAAGEKQTFTGVITDDMCERGDHSRMGMGPTDAACTLACVMEHGAQFVLWDGKSVYVLSDQKKPEMFAGKKVTVSGTLDAKTRTIRVDSIAAAK